MKKVYFVLLFLLIAIFLVNGAEAESLKKGEVYRSLDGKVIEVISGDELEITKDNKITLARYGFKDDKLRVVFGDNVIYYEIVNEGLKDEKTGEIYYSKEALVKAEEEMRRAEEVKRKREEKTKPSDCSRDRSEESKTGKPMCKEYWPQDGGGSYRWQPFKKK